MQTQTLVTVPSEAVQCPAQPNSGGWLVWTVTIGFIVVYFGGVFCAGFIKGLAKGINNSLDKE